MKKVVFGTWYFNSMWNESEQWGIPETWYNNIPWTMLCPTFYWLSSVFYPGII